MQYVWRMLVIATLGSILDSQLSWESGKFQLARWSHKVVIFSVRTVHPAGHLTIWMLDLLGSWNFLGVLFFNVVRCPQPNCSPHQQSMCGVPPPRICFPLPQLHPFKKVCAISPLPVYGFFLTPIAPHIKKECAESPLPVYVFSYGMSNLHPCPPHPPI